MRGAAPKVSRGSSRSRPLDTLAYEPTTIEVAEGETITFVVSNPGDIDHEFVVGDERTQRMAEEEMSEGMHGHKAAMVTRAGGRAAGRAGDRRR